MDEVFILATELFTSLTLRDAVAVDVDPEGYDHQWTFVTELRTKGGAVVRPVTDSSPGIAAFFRSLADALGGFDDERRYTSADRRLEIYCRHDRRSAVICEIKLADHDEPPWRYTAQLSLASGSHLESIADELEAFINERTQ